MGVPLRKGEDGEDIRPILIGQALMSLPGACLKQITRGKVEKLLLPSQLGNGPSSAPETYLCLGNALAKLCPEDAFCAFDVHNAFGKVFRAAVLQEVVAEVPELANFLICLWGDNGAPAYVADGSASCCIFRVHDGLFQGHNLSSILFCLAMRRAIRRFTDSYPVSAHIEYIDDMLMQLKAAEVHIWLPLLEQALSTVNLQLNRRKCKVWVPSCPLDVSLPSSGLLALHRYSMGWKLWVAPWMACSRLALVSPAGPLLVHR